MRYLLKMPNKKYHTIYADPPWLYKTAGIKRPMHFERMTTEEIIGMKDLIKQIMDREFCHLWLWTTNTHLPEALQVMKEWGFTYKTMVTWVKPQLGLGIWIRSVTEQLLFGVKGKKRKKPGRIKNVIFAPRRKYCQKPDEAYGLIEALSFPPYIELFATKTRKGWDSLILDLPTTKQIGVKEG